jgi:hypothetical protein
LKKAVNILVLAFYTFGSFCLPLGDFSMLTGLPQMYRHCKATEDKDMNPLDFVTDHLLNIDGLFDKHDNGDEQKPHTPVPFHHHGQTIVTIVPCLIFSVAPFQHTAIKPITPSDNFHPSDYISKILRPPIA